MRYSAPIIGGTAAAIWSNSLSAGTGMAGLVLPSPMPAKPHKAVM